jgi:transcriptional regulator with XRE-family HTH domain
LDSAVNGAPEGQEMDEQDTASIPSVGEQLRKAREKMKLSLEDVASQTRIPRRHLESIEASEWSELPAPTYTIGFAKSYASAVGLDRTAIGEQVRDELGGQRPTQTALEVFEPADPARAMPTWLVFGAIVAVILVVLLFSWLNNRSLEPSDGAGPAIAASSPAQPSAAPAPAPAPAARGPVVLTALQPVWIRVYEKRGPALFERVLGAGETYRVPPTATAPLLRTGKPEALRITVGTVTAPAVGAPATTISDVSLLGPDLMHTGQPSSNSASQPAPNQPPAPALQNSAG